MKIIQIMPEFASAGAEIMCENLCKELLLCKQDVLVISFFSLHSDITKRLENAGIKIFFLEKKLGFDLAVLPKLRKILKKEKPDVIHTHRYILPYVMLASFGLGVRRFVHTVHNVADKECGFYLRKINFFFYHFFNVTPVALSESVKKSIIKEYLLSEKKVPVIFNGIDLKKCLIKRNYALNESFKILHVGRFSKQKNHLGLIRAFGLFHERCPNSQLYLIGEGAEYCKVKQLVAEKKLQNDVFFVGVTDKVFDFMSQSDVFILPSFYEGVPMTLIEAMGTGLPIIASNVGGVPDMLKNNIEGILVDLDEQNIAKAIFDLYDNENLRKKIGENALKRSQIFSSSMMASEYIKIYEGLFR